MYSLYPKFKQQYAKIPISIYQQREQDFKTIRNVNLPDLNCHYPEIEGLNHDFIVNGYRTQEKVAGLRKDRIETYLASLYKSNGKLGSRRQFQSYKKGDNHFYWVWLEGKSDRFYIFPEQMLIERNIVDAKDGRKPVISITKNNWTKDYLYTINDIENVYKIFEIS